MRRGKFVLLLIGIVLVSLVTGGWALLRRHATDPYAFLSGRSPVDVGVTGPGSFGLKEIRVYTWRQPWQQVAKEAAPEMSKLKLKQRKSNKATDPFVVWEEGIIDGGLCGTSADTSIYIQPGKALPLTEFGSISDKDPEWVTVIMSSTLDESWVNVIRYTCFAMREK